MVGSMLYEPFYVSNMFSVPEVGVYGGWVTYENSLAAGRVYSDQGENVVLLLSGECVVDDDIRVDDTSNHDRLKRSDLDSLIDMYECMGQRFVEKLNGLFSGVLVDKRTGEAILFNDRYGVNRIYWHQRDDETYFASEAKALLSILPDLREFDERGVAQLVTYGCTTAGRTLFRNIELLPNASLWSFKHGTFKKRTYFSPHSWESQPALSVREFSVNFEDTFKRVVRRYYNSESSLGISLTAGLDSRMILACRPALAALPICYTFSGRDGYTLDDRLAERVANAAGLRHYLLRLGSDFFLDFPSHADRTVYVTDGCFGVLGAHEIYLNKQAGRLATVRLTGNYGGELLRGVSTFKRLKLAPGLFDPPFSRVLSAAQTTINSGNSHPMTFAAFEEVPYLLFGSLAASRSQVVFRTPYLDNELVELAYRMPTSLRESTAPARHVIRANDASLAGIPTDKGQSDTASGVSSCLRRLVAEATFKLDYLYNEGWPDLLSPIEPIFKAVASRAKLIGLHKYLHYRSWFREDLSEYLREAVANARNQPFWDRRFLEKMAGDHVRGRKNYIQEIDILLTLEAVERLLFRDSAYAPRTANNSEQLASLVAQNG